MKLWKFLFGFIVIFAVLIIGTSVRQAFISKSLTNNDNKTSGLIPYRNILVDLQPQDASQRPIKVSYNFDIDPKAELGKTKHVEFVFSPDSKNLILKEYSMDAIYNKSYNHQTIINIASKKILEENHELNIDYYFDNENKLLSVKKLFYDNQTFNSGFELTRNDTKQSFKNPENVDGGMWQIAGNAVYLNKKDYLVIHYFNSMDENGKNLITVIDLKNNKTIFTFETLPFNWIKFDRDQDFVYTIDDKRFDTEFFDLQDGQKHSINNQNYILASDVLDNDHKYGFITGTKNEINAKDRYMPIGENSDQFVKIWNVETKNLLDSIPVSNDTLTDIIATSTSRIIVTGNESGSIEFIDLIAKKTYLTLEPNPEAIKPINDTVPFKISISPDEKVLVAFNKDGKLYFWNLDLNNI